MWSRHVAWRMGFIYWRKWRGLYAPVYLYRDLRDLLHRGLYGYADSDVSDPVTCRYYLVGLNRAILVALKKKHGDRVVAKGEGNGSGQNDLREPEVTMALIDEVIAGLDAYFAAIILGHSSARKIWKKGVKAWVKLLEEK